MDMDVSIMEDCLKNTCDFSIDFLDTTKATFGNASWKSWNLFNTYNSLISNDKQFDFIIDPREENKGDKYEPIDTEASPEYSRSK